MLRRVGGIVLTAKHISECRQAAIADLNKGDKLASEKVAGANVNVPPWVEMTRDLATQDTEKLSAQITPNAPGLASYFACLTVENAPMPSLPINFANAAPASRIRVLSVSKQ